MKRQAATKGRHGTEHRGSAPTLDLSRDSYLYAEEKFGLAVHVLAVGTGSIKDRLAEAFQELVALGPSELPACLRDDLAWIRESLTSRPAKTQRIFRAGEIVAVSGGRLNATLATMRVARAAEIAERIFNVHSRLAGRTPCGPGDEAEMPDSVT
jgi:hypothetical protein